MEVPTLLTKKYLKYHFGVSYDYLRLKIFTDDLLKEMNLTRQDFNHIQLFSPTQSIFLKNKFNLS